LRKLILNKPVLTSQLQQALEGEYKDKPLQITIKQAVNIKTTAQLGYYFTLIKLIIDETGDKDTDIKFKYSTGFTREIFLNGEIKVIPKSKANATIKDASKLIERAVEVCHLLNIRIPMQEQHYRNMHV